MVVVGDEGFVFRGRGIWGWFHYGLWLCDLCPPDCFWKVWREVVHGHVEREREKERERIQDRWCDGWVIDVERLGKGRRGACGLRGVMIMVLMWKLLQLFDVGRNDNERSRGRHRERERPQACKYESTFKVLRDEKISLFSV